MFFDMFKRKNKNKKTEFIDSELDIEQEFSKHREYDKKDKMFDEIEQLQYIRTQCEQVVESSRYIEELKMESQAVESYLSDIQIIDNLPKKERKKISEAAVGILKIEDGRKLYRQTEPALSGTKTARFNKYKDEFPEALTNLLNDEKYAQAVKHDMRILEAEKVSLKEDIDNYSKRRIHIRNISIVSLVAIIAVFAIFAVAGLINGESGMPVFMIVLLLIAIYVLLIFFMQRNALYRIKLSEKKLARAVTLLNKVKIKYVNIMNSVDYQLAKYDVKNAYQLSNEYEKYLQDKKAYDRFKSSSADLEEANVTLQKMLSKLNLYDESIWTSQIGALADQKEMVEVKHKLNIRKQKLKNQVEYNIGRIEDAKKGVISFVKKHPDKADNVMEIVDSYDIDI